MARSTSQVKTGQQKFLDAIAQGHTILEAASSVGVSRSTIYNWREADPAFAKAWEFAYENGTDVYGESRTRSSNQWRRKNNY